MELMDLALEGRHQEKLRRKSDILFRRTLQQERI
jgi:hypothetical protein